MACEASDWGQGGRRWPNHEQIFLLATPRDGVAGLKGLEMCARSGGPRWPRCSSLLFFWRIDGDVVCQQSVKPIKYWRCHAYLSQILFRRPERSDQLIIQKLNLEKILTNAYDYLYSYTFWILKPNKKNVVWTLKGWRQYEKKTMDAIHRKSELGDTAAESWHMHYMVSMLLVNPTRE